MGRIGTWAVLVIGLAVGCKKPAPPDVPTVEEDEIVAMLRDRPVPDPTNGRFSIKMRSKPLGIAAPRLAGGLVVDRPDRAYLAILDPVGSPVVTMHSDGDTVVFMNNRDKLFVAQADADEAMGLATEGAVGLSDAVSMLLGLLPLDDAQVTERVEEDDDTTRFTFEGPGGIVIRAWVDTGNATPRRVEVDDTKGQRAVNASYEPYQVVEGALLPTAVVLEVPKVELTLDVRFKTWKRIPQAPDVFAPTAPDTYETISFREFLDRMGDTVGRDEGTSGEDGSGAAE